MSLLSWLRAISFFAITMLMVLVPVLFDSFVDFKAAKDNNQLAATINDELFKRYTLRDHYFIYHDERSRIEWIKQKEVTNRLIHQAIVQFDSTKDHDSLEKLLRNDEDVSNIYARIVTNIELLKTGSISSRHTEERLNLLTTQLMVKSSAIHEAVEALQQQSARQLESTFTRLIAVSAFSITFMSIATPIILAVIGGQVRKRLALLHAGARIVSSGNLDYRMDIDGPDEFADLAVSLNSMTGKLQSFTDQLESELKERRRVEEMLRNERDFAEGLVETAPTIVLLLDTQGRIVRFNPYMETISGYKLDEVKGKDWFSTFLPSSLQDQARVLFPKTLHDIQTKSNVNIVVTRGGQERLIEWHNKAIKNADGKIVGLLAIGQDVTERKQAEDELKRSNAELEQFSYAISHDMRQPLRMISSFMQLLEKRLAGQLDGDNREFFDFAIDGARRLDQMLVALLEYSRVGRKGEPPTWVESRALLDEALLFLQPEIADAQAELTITGDWSRVYVSRDEMIRLIQNLIDNAVKYRVAGRTPEITVTSETSNNEWRLSVTDNGVGILPDQIHRLFQVFQRLHTQAAYEGTGIGLALCRKIAEHHGGRITAESAGEGQGSRFCVSLPQQQPVDGGGKDENESL